MNEIKFFGLFLFIAYNKYMLSQNQPIAGRPRLGRRIRFNPAVNYFKPQGVPMRNLAVVELEKEEVEALRLKNIENLDQNECAKKMKTSQSTFQRILVSAYKKLSEAIINGKAIKIIND